MRALTSKDGALLLPFDKIDETEYGNNKTLLKQMLINNHTEANIGKIKGHLPLEHINGFCKTFRKITKNLGFHLTFGTNELQDSLFTTLGDNINVTIYSLYLYVSVLIPNTETQVLLLNLSKITVKSHMIHGIQNANYPQTVMNFKSILVVPKMLILLNI